MSYFFLVQYKFIRIIRERLKSALLEQFENIVWELGRPHNHQVHQHLCSLVKGGEKKNTRTMP